MRDRGEPLGSFDVKEDLGLAFCRNVVAAHGGEILVDSEEGKGSTFTMVLPKHASPTNETS